jgi:hypothetical protein
MYVCRVGRTRKKGERTEVVRVVLELARVVAASNERTSDDGGDSDGECGGEEVAL